MVLGISSVVIEFVALSAYALWADQARRIAGTRALGILERIGGGLLVAAGARLAVVRVD